MISVETQKKSKKASKVPEHKPHDHTPQLKRLSRIKGQVEGVERMIVDRRYCPEIVMQIKAIRSALKSLEITVIEGHIKHCVKHAIDSRDPYVVQEKVDEILELIKGQG
jgi:CsoR family transcriptional regulator, copper-sensing transcriptional repressor